MSKEERIRILNSDDLYSIMQRILLREQKIDQNREHFWVIGLANDHRLLFVELISLGTVNQTLAEPMEVFSLALQKRAVAIMLVHNHPSGNLTPSEEDKDITDRLIQSGRILHTEVLDHLIITEKTYLSFRDTGLMGELEKSLKYVPAYMQRDQLYRELVEEIGRHRSKEIAKNLRKQGMSLDEIKEATGLREGEILGEEESE